MMFDQQRRIEVLSATREDDLGRDAQIPLQAVLRELLIAHPQIRSVTWTQSLDHPSPEVFVVHDVVLDLATGILWEADTAAPHDVLASGVDPAAYAVLADVLLAQTDLLVTAFGLGVRITASANGITTVPCHA